MSHESVQSYSSPKREEDGSFLVTEEEYRYMLQIDGLYRVDGAW